MHHATTIGVGYQSVIHCGVLRQAAEIVSITPIQECLSDIEPTMHHLPMKSAQNDETCYSVGQEIIDSIQNEKFVLRTGASKFI